MLFQEISGTQGPLMSVFNVFCFIHEDGVCSVVTQTSQLSVHTGQIITGGFIECGLTLIFELK